MRTLYLQAVPSFNPDRGLFSTDLAKHLKDESHDGFHLAHAVWPDERDDPIPEASDDILWESELEAFAPDFVYIEDGLYAGEAKVRPDLIRELALDGTVIVIADVDRNDADDDRYRRDVDSLKAVPTLRDGRPVYAIDETHFLERQGPSTVMFRPQLMHVDESLVPVFDGIDGVAGGLPVAMHSPGGRPLLSGNAGTTTLLRMDLPADGSPVYTPFAVVAAMGSGAVVTVGAAISHDRTVRANPDNARFVSNVASHLLGDGHRYTELRAGRAPRFDGEGREPANLEGLLAQPEGSQLEFKSTARMNVHTGKVDDEIEFAVVKTVSAFANADGGTLLIGVDDDGEVIGVERDYPLVKHRNQDGFELWLTDLFVNQLGKTRATELDVSLHQFDDGTVCRVDVPAGDEPLFVMSPDGSRRFYVRLNNRSEPFEGEEILDYRDQRWPRQ